MDFAAFLETFSAAVSRADAEGFSALFTEDACYHDGFFGAHHGRAAIGAMLLRFHEGGERLAWQFLEPLSDGTLGYARYVFSYRSRQPESAGRLIAFDGIARMRLQGGLIADYAEAFDRGSAFTVLGYAGPRVLKLLDRYAAQMENSAPVREHLAWREARGL